MMINASHYYPIHSAFSIVYNFHSQCNIPQTHCHNSYEILLPFCDDLKCIADNQEYEVKIGDVFIFPPHLPHRVVPPPNTIYERYIIYFRIEYINSFSPLAQKLIDGIFEQSIQGAPCIHLGEEQVVNLISLIRKTQQYICSPDYAQEIYIQHTFFEILLLLSKQSFNQNSNSCANRNTNYLKMKDVLTYVYCNLSEDLSLNHLTGKFYVSKTYLNKIFKMYTGSTVNQYIITIRIDTSKKLLQEGIPVSEIYEKVGFNNYSHFIRTFTKIVGTSPKQYAIKYQKL